MGEIEFLGDRTATIAGINIGGTNTTGVGGLGGGTVGGAGVAVGGPLSVRRGQVTEAVHLPGLHGVRLRDRIADATGRAVGLHHDAAACALAEWRWGPNAGVDGLAYLTCGTGFGCGLVLGGKARYALDGRSSEIGHVRFRDEGPAL